MFKHLLATLDGSPRAESVVPLALDIAKAMGAEITLLRIVRAGNSDKSEPGEIGEHDASASSESIGVDQATKYLNRVAEELQRQGVTAHIVVKHGSPAEQIVSAAREAGADAIMMATHSRRGINRLMFGSVAEEVLHESPLPILLIRAA